MNATPAYRGRATSSPTLVCAPQVAAARQRLVSPLPVVSPLSPQHQQLVTVAALFLAGSACGFLLTITLFLAMGP